VEVGEDEVRWWTWAGGRGNATLAAALPQLVDEDGRVDNHSLRLRSDVTLGRVRAAVDALDAGTMAAPDVTDDAVRELKFGEILPPDLAIATLPSAWSTRTQSSRCWVGRSNGTTASCRA